MKTLTFSYQKAIIASIEASKVIMEFYEKGFKSEYKKDGSPVTEADFAASRVIHEHLLETNIPILGEESEHPSFEIRKDWTSNWCVDPLDGTKEYINRNGEFAVNIALIENNISTFGVIAWPTEKKVIFGGSQIGVFVSHFDSIQNSTTWEKLSNQKLVNAPLVMATSRFPDSGDYALFIEQLKQNHPHINFLKKGSALKFFDLAYGFADISPRFAPTMEWDIAAGQAIIECLGGVIYSAETGLPLRYNKESLFNPYFIAMTHPLVKIK